VAAVRELLQAGRVSKVLVHVNEYENIGLKILGKYGKPVRLLEPSEWLLKSIHTKSGELLFTIIKRIVSFILCLFRRKEEAKESLDFEFLHFCPKDKKLNK